MTCEPITGGVLCRPSGKRATRTRAVRWCFKCRRRHYHRLVLIGTSDVWYEPMPSWECETCGEDHTQFPQG